MNESKHRLRYIAMGAKVAPSLDREAVLFPFAVLKVPPLDPSRPDPTRVSFGCRIRKKLAKVSRRTASFELWLELAPSPELPVPLQLPRCSASWRYCGFADRSDIAAAQWLQQKYLVLRRGAFRQGDRTYQRKAPLQEPVP